MADIHSSRDPNPPQDPTRIPYGVYRDPEIYARERERLFMGPCWNFLCLECEIPNPGDYKTTHIGDVPVIVVRDETGAVRALENRCAHRGAQVCLEKFGNSKRLTCVYHAWSYDLRGKLVGVAFRNGVKGQGGMPPEFNPADHGLRALAVEVFHGLVFASFHDGLPPVAKDLGPEIAARVRRVFNRPVKVLGHTTQVLRNNWKLYVENVKDSYHASILHLFFTTFKINRLSQKGGIIIDDSGGHHVSYSMIDRDSASPGQRDAGPGEKTRADKDGFRLADPSLLETRDEFGDGITLQILTVFPNFVIQQIQNSLAVRQVIPRGVEETEIRWTHFGFVDDDADMLALRLKQSNMVGPAGYISMEDGAVGAFVQRAITGSDNQDSVMMMGGAETVSTMSRAPEASVRGFWKAYRARMNP
jgi:phenylpropionate dioxygenase-like ring-hydroxylating dioxygenase large terminal subunit